MSENSKIEWTHHTFNPWWGCAKVSPGCDHCYAEALGNRFGTKWGVDTERRVFGEQHWQDPIKWNAKAAVAGERHRVFCSSMADVFDKNSPPNARERIWQLMRVTPHLDWLLLTKRIGNAERMLPPDWGDGYRNAWLGISVVNQEEAARDIPKLLATPARIRFLSMEPLLEQVDITPWLRPGAAHENVIDWIIVGGESGPKARPMDRSWVESLREQCAAAGTAFFFKQWGEFMPIADPINAPPVMRKVGRKIAGRELDGRTYNNIPEAHP
jgi:protein gp37